MRLYPVIILAVLCMASCDKSDDAAPPPPPPRQVAVRTILLENISFDNTAYGTSVQPAIKVQFTEPLMQSSVPSALSLTEKSGAVVPVTGTLQNSDSVLLIQVNSPLNFLTKYNFKISNLLQSASGGSLSTPVDKNFITRIDSSRKFPLISDNALLDKLQQQTFKYFWDFAHPVSGLARERSNGDNNVVTSGGSGFGVMAIIAAINRGFITRAEGFTRLQTIVSFLKNTAQKFHGAFPHWLHGGTGAVIPFSAKDNGADLVETSYLIQGLLCVRQYFTGTDAAETALRNDINSIWQGVEWSWFRRNNENTLYWHWSPSFNWDMNFQVRGWNECLITYVLAASSTTYGIPQSVYANGWAGNGTNGFLNGNIYYGYLLPLGPSIGGPLFFAHYSFLGMNPNGLSDIYANYLTQTKNHTLINYNYCKANPRGFFGYSDSIWGLTASDVPNGYAASSPTNDLGVIAPTAALSSIPYTPAESMAALRFFYYVLGDRIWKEYGFVDAFSLHEPWFASSFLAIDQGPIIVMTENYRSGLLWNLFTSCSEVKTGMQVLGFTAPYL